MIAKMEELADIEIHKHTYPVSRTEFADEGARELMEVVRELVSF